MTTVFEMANNYSHPYVWPPVLPENAKSASFALRLLTRCVRSNVRSCNPNAIDAELTWHGREGGWRVYLRDMLRAFAYVMALPGIASVTEHYGQRKTELHLVASTGELHAIGWDVCVAKQSR